MDNFRFTQGEKLQVLVERSDEKKSTLAERFGTTAANFSRFFKRDILPKLVKDKACQIFDVPPAYFKDTYQLMEQGAPAAKADTGSELMQLSEQVRKLKKQVVSSRLETYRDMRDMHLSLLRAIGDSDVKRRVLKEIAKIKEDSRSVAVSEKDGITRLIPTKKVDEFLNIDES